jgi:uncharacterized membrane protein
MLEKIDPQALRLIIITSICMVAFPISVYYIASCTPYVDFTSSFTDYYKVVINGFASVITVNIVITIFIIQVYKLDINKKDT